MQLNERHDGVQVTDGAPAIGGARSLHGVRVLVHSINYAPEFTGTGRYSGEIVAELVRLGAEVTAIAAPPHYPGWRIQAGYRNWFSSEVLEGARVVRAPLFLARNVRGITRLLAPLSFALSSVPVTIWLLITGRPHVLLYVEPTLFAAPLAASIAKLMGARTVLHVQDLEIDGAFEVGHLPRGGLAMKLAFAFERLTLRLFDHVITISEGMRQRLVGKGVPAKRTAVVRNWVDLAKVSPLPDPFGYRDVLGVPRDKFVVLYSGNIGAKQGLTLLCEAAEKLRDNPRILFLLAGDGPERERLVKRYGTLPNLQFLPFQPEERLGDFLNMPDLHVILQLANATDFALPSKLGGILASGRPLLVTANPDQELSILLDGAATIILPGDPELLAESIANLSLEPDDSCWDRRAAIARQLSKPESVLRFSTELLGPLGTSFAKSVGV